MSNDSNKFHVQLSGLTNKLIKNESKIRKYLTDSFVKKYSREFELVFRNKPHILNDDEQKIMSTVGIINGGFSQIFSTLNDSEVKFKNAIDSKGKKIPLNTIADVMANIKHKDRAIRKST
jgi:oligoendopeptidase F